MSDIAIKAENISKLYNLGSIGTGSLFRDIDRWFAVKIGKEDPYSIIHSGEKKSNQHWALKDVSFEIKKGESVGIIGKNGAGKSTLLKILSRVTTPTTGTIKVNGRIASLLEVGTGFHGDLTGKENIFMNGAILGMSRREISSKLDEIIDFSGIENYIDTPVKRYSSGMYVRLAFAVAAHLEPDILIVDEVLAVGDAEFQKKCLGKMDDASKKEGRTVLFVSHNMGAVAALCQKGILLEKGNLKTIGEASVLINAYNHSNNIFNQEIFFNNRKVYSDIQFTNISIKNCKNETTNIIENGKKCWIEVQINTSKSIDFDKLQIDIGINNNLNQAISWLSTSINHENINQKNKGKHIKILFEISNLPLSEGIYLLTLFCKYNGIVSDYIEDAYKFEIVDGDFYKNGRKNINYGNTIIKHSSKIESILNI